MEMPLAAVYLQPGCACVSDALHNCVHTLAQPQCQRTEHQGFLKIWDSFYNRNGVGLFSLERTDEVQL